jgi:NADH-quinone oxidoreductase subunit L
VHHQYFHYHPAKSKPLSAWQASRFVLGVKEWNLDRMMKRFAWDPFKWIGKQFVFLGSNGALTVVTVLAVISFSISVIKPEFVTQQGTLIATAMLVIALAITLFTFSSRGSAIKAWIYLLIAHLFIITGVGLNTTHIYTTEILFYTSGVGIAFAAGLVCLSLTKKLNNKIDLDKYHGYVYEQRWEALGFLLSAIGMLGFPITAAFIGIDVFFTYIGDDQELLIVLLAFCFIFIELAAIRIFLRVYLGPHIKLDHPVAFRST